MKNTTRALRALIGTLLGGVLLGPACGFAGQYTNFDVSIYMVVNAVIAGGQNPANLANQWRQITNQVKVDKVYIEAQRDRTMASDAAVETVKKFFLDRGVKVGGGMCLS